jgi:hypothetical protein
MMVGILSIPHPEITLDETDFQFGQFPFEPALGEGKILTGPLQADTSTQPSIAAMEAVSGGGSDE